MLEGQVVIVTGGGRGLGRAHCLELARHGATVVVNDVGAGLNGEVGDESPAEQVVAEIEAAGGRALCDDTSVTDYKAMRLLVERVVDECQRLDAVVNNAGILRDRMLTSMSEDDFDSVIAVHLKGTFNLTRHACTYWKQERKSGSLVSGRVVNTSSGSGLFGNIGQGNYGPAKAAIASLTMITAMEMARYGVTANAVSPIARTRMTTQTMSMTGPVNGDWDRYDPANASPVVAWLCSEASGWLTGAVLRVDGNSVRRMRPWEIDSACGYEGPAGERVNGQLLDKEFRIAYGVLPGGPPRATATLT